MNYQRKLTLNNKLRTTFPTATMTSMHIDTVNVLQPGYNQLGILCDPERYGTAVSMQVIKKREYCAT